MTLGNPVVVAINPVAQCVFLRSRIGPALPATRVSQDLGYPSKPFEAVGDVGLPTVGFGASRAVRGKGGAGNNQDANVLAFSMELPDAAGRYRLIRDGEGIGHSDSLGSILVLADLGGFSLGRPPGLGGGRAEALAGILGGPALGADGGQVGTDFGGHAHNPSLHYPLMRVQGKSYYTHRASEGFGLCLSTGQDRPMRPGHPRSLRGLS